MRVLASVCAHQLYRKTWWSISHSSTRSSFTHNYFASKWLVRRQMGTKCYVRLLPYQPIQTKTPEVGLRSTGRSVPSQFGTSPSQNFHKPTSAKVNSQQTTRTKLPEGTSSASIAPTSRLNRWNKHGFFSGALTCPIALPTSSPAALVVPLRALPLLNSPLSASRTRSATRPDLRPYKAHVEPTTTPAQRSQRPAGPSESLLNYTAKGLRPQSLTPS